MDKIDQIIEKAISYTRMVLRLAPAHLDVARAGLERLRDNLALDAPDHPGLARLRYFIDDLEMRAAERSLH